MSGEPINLMSLGFFLRGPLRLRPLRLIPKSSNPKSEYKGITRGREELEEREWIYLRSLVGLTAMRFKEIESFREWAPTARRRKGSISFNLSVVMRGARGLRDPLSSAASSDEIILRPEPARPEFIAKLRSSEVPWLDLKQMTEPGVCHRELISTRPRHALKLRKNPIQR